MSLGITRMESLPVGYLLRPDPKAFSDGMGGWSAVEAV